MEHRAGSAVVHIIIYLVFLRGDRVRRFVLVVCLSKIPNMREFTMTPIIISISGVSSLKKGEMALVQREFHS